MNSANGCNTTEKTFIKKINKMSDAQLKKEFKLRQRETIRTKGDAKNWHTPYRKELFVAMALMERGFHKEDTWVKN